jgi:glycosyltransferase involved in cell wall biosynthesis
VHVGLVTLGDPDTLTGGYLYHRRMAEAASSFGFSISFISFKDGPFPLPVVRGPGVVRSLRKERPDAVVIDSIAAWALGPWTRGVKDVPLLGMVHQPPGGINHGPLRTRLQGLMDRLCYKRAALVMVASESLVADFRNLGFAENRVVVVPPGRDVAIPEGRTDRARLRAGRRIALLSVANWLPRKGVTDLLEAVALLPDGLVTLHLVGNDSADPRYARSARRLIDSAGLRDRVVVHGPLPKERVASMYEAVDAFALVSTKESYGTVYGEAMAFGLPVVGWRAGNLQSLARDGVEGFLVTVDDVGALATALSRLATDDEMRARMSAAAAERATSLPTWSQTAERFFDSIRVAVGGTHANS